MATMDRAERVLRVLTQGLLDGASTLSFALRQAQGAGIAGLAWLCCLVQGEKFQQNLQKIF